MTMAQKPNFSLTTQDIIGEKRTFFSRPDLFNVRDIDGAFPIKNQAEKSKRVVNPLDPSYQLPSFQIRPVTPPRFIRDHMDVSDIEGAQPAVAKVKLIATRNHIDYSDIHGSSANWRTKTRDSARRDAVRNTLDCQDINRGPLQSGHFKSRRVTNPLAPQYEYDSQRSKGSVGEILGSKPGRNDKISRSKTRNQFALTTQDIPGACVPTLPMNKPRKQVRHAIDVSDIDGAQPGTKKKLSTRRATNPLNPDYTFLDHEREQPRPRSSASSVQSARSRSRLSSAGKTSVASRSDAPAKLQPTMTKHWMTPDIVSPAFSGSQPGQLTRSVLESHNSSLNGTATSRSARSSRSIASAASSRRSVSRRSQTAAAAGAAKRAPSVAGSTKSRTSTASRQPTWQENRNREQLAEDVQSVRSLS